MDEQRNVNYGRDQFVINQPGSVKIDASSGLRPVSVIGLNLNKLEPLIDGANWIERDQPQAGLLAGIEARQIFLEVIGAGGFGKTWLVAQVYQQVKSQFDCARWVNFGKVPSFHEFACWVLQEIGFPLTTQLAEQIEDDALIRELVFRLREGGRCLVVMDQLEALLEAPDRDAFVLFLQRWQQKGNQSTIIATARQSFWPSESAAPQRLNLAGLTPAEGETLLRQQHQLAPAGENDLQRLVEIAGGHPLLLNLAASWLQQNKTTTVDGTALGFFETLFANYQGDPETQVEKIFTVLFDALAAPLQTLLIGVSVYRDPFDLAMAQGMLPEATAADLEQLRAQAFLLEQAERWTLHPLMQQSVQQVMQQREETNAAHEKAIAYFQAHLKSSGSSIADVTEYLESVHHYCELQQYGEADRMMDRCFTFLDRLGYYRELAQVYERLTGGWQAQAPTEPAAQTNLAWAWTRLGNCYQTLGQVDVAISAHQQAWYWFELAESKQGQAACLGNLGNAYFSLGQYQRAIELQEQHLAIAREIGDRKGEANSLGNLGIAYKSLGQYPQAIELYEQSLAIKREIGNRNGEATSLFNLAAVLARYAPRRFEALERFQQARTIFAELGLDHLVKQCDEAIHAFNQIIATEQPHVPRAPEIGTPRSSEESAPPSMVEPVTPQPSGSSSRGMPQWQQMLWLFGGSFAVIVIAKLLLDP